MPRLLKPLIKAGLGGIWVGFLVAAPPAGAVQSDSLGVYPTGSLGSSAPWFRYYLDRDQSTVGSITVDNRSNSLQPLSLYAVDAAPNGDGGFGMAPRSSRPVDAGSWIQLSENTVALEPHTTHDVNFKFKVPRDASAGPHYAGIVAQPLQPARRAGSNVAVITRLGVRVYATVAGIQHPDLKIASLSVQATGKHIFLVARLHNTGNTLLAPGGNLALKAPFSHQTTTFNAGMALRPGGWLTVRLPTNLSTQGLPLPYRAQLTLHYGRHGLVTRTASFWAGSKVMALLATTVGAIAVLAMMLVAGRKYRAHRDHHRHKRQPGEP